MLPPVATAIAKEVKATWHLIDDENECHSNLDSREVWTPVPDQGNMLAAFAHECGHLATTDKASHSGVRSQFILEWLATKWGLEAIERHGGEVTEDMRGFLAQCLWGYATDKLDVIYGMERPEMPQIVSFLKQHLKGPAIKR